MPDATDLRLLTSWCRGRGLCWHPLRRDADAATLLLEPLAARHPWQRMVLTEADDGYRLEDEIGQMLAAASDLPALLDALDGGVGDAPVAGRDVVETALAL